LRAYSSHGHAITVREKLSSSFSGLTLLAANAREPEDARDDAAVKPAVHPDEHVLYGRHLLEEPDVLERPADAALGGGMRGLAADVLAVEDHSPVRGLVDARDHVEERRLPGTVRTDEADDRPERDREIDVIDGDQPAELLAESNRLEEKFGHVRYPSSGACRTSIRGSSWTPVSNSSCLRRSGIRPSGRNNITMTMIAP
jgi:hypothetical protein